MKTLIKYALFALTTASLCSIATAQENAPAAPSHGYTQEELSYIGFSNPLLAMYLSYMYSTETTEPASASAHERLSSFLEETLGLTTHEAMLYTIMAIVTIEASVQANGGQSPMVMPLIRAIRSLLEGPAYPGQAGGLPRPRENFEEIMEALVEAAPCILVFPVTPAGSNSKDS